MKDILKLFGARVRDLRKARGLSQEELAERAGLCFTYIGGVERGERNLTLKSIKRIADALGIDMRGLFILSSSKRIDKEADEIINDINSILADKDVNILRLIRQVVRGVDGWLKEIEE